MSDNVTPEPVVAPATTPSEAPPVTVETVATGLQQNARPRHTAPAPKVAAKPAMEHVPMVPAKDPEIVAKGTVVETNRAPFSGTTVETFDAVQVSAQGEADYEEETLGNGTVIRTYKGVQPGVQLVTPLGDAIVATEALTGA